MTKQGMVDNGLKRVFAGLWSLRSVLRQDGGRLSMDDLRKLSWECEEMQKQVGTLNTTVAQLVRNASHNGTSK